MVLIVQKKSFDITNSDAMYKEADDALYETKNLGRNCVLCNKKYMKIRVGTFNLFQFVEPPYCWYTKHEKFKQEEVGRKINLDKNQITEMNCDVIGFQEVFLKNIKRASKRVGI